MLQRTVTRQTWDEASTNAHRDPDPDPHSWFYRAVLSYGRRAFCVAGPSVWNSLPDILRNTVTGGNSFRQSLKTFLLATYWCIKRIRGFTTMCYINWLFTYLLTYGCGRVSVWGCVLNWQLRDRDWSVYLSAGVRRCQLWQVHLITVS